MKDIISQLGGFSKIANVMMSLKNFGDNVTASSVTGADLLRIAEHFEVPLESGTAELVAAAIPEYALDADETITNFVTGGGFMRMLFSKYQQQQGNTGQLANHMTDIVRCPHCDNLVF